MPRTALIIAYYFPPMGMAGVQRAAKLAKYLPRCGYEVIVLTVKPIRYSAYDKTLLDELPQEVQIYRAGSTDPSRIAYFVPMIANIGEKFKTSLKQKGKIWPDSKIGWKKSVLRLADEIIRDRKIDVIFSTSPPITSHLVAMELKDRYSLRWVADFRDIWESRPPEQLYDDPVLIDKSRRLLDRISDTADVVTAVNGTIGSELSGESITLLGGYDPDDFKSIDAIPTDDKFILCYMGTFCDLHPIEPFLKAASIAVAGNSRFAEKLAFRIIGANNKKDIRDKAKGFGLAEKIELFDYLPHRDAINLAATAAVFLLSVPVGHEDIITGKIFDYLALPPPILASVPSGGEAEKIIAQYGAGISVDPGNAEEMAKEMIRLYQMWLDNNRWDKKDISDLSRLKMADRLAKLFDGICNVE